MTGKRCRFLPLIFIFASLGFLSACSKPIGTDALEASHPTIEKVQELRRQQNPEEAISLCRETLLKHPEFARLHLELGALWQSQGKPIDAVYHYNKYLEIRPDSDKSEMVTELKTKILRDLVAELDGFVPAGMVDEGVGHIGPIPVGNEETVDTDVPEVSATPGPTPSLPKTHTVRRGDTLGKISRKWYGQSSRWKEIYEANKDVIPANHNLKIGQVLIIP